MKDLTVGKPMKVIWLFAVPMILGQIAQQFGVLYMESFLAWVS